MGRFPESRRASQDRLWERYWADPTNHEAFQDLVVSYQGFVRLLATKMTLNGELLDDLIQVATIGLIKAIRRFKPGQYNAKFTTYATITIVGELKRYHRDKGWQLHIPRQLQELYLELRRLEDQFCSEHGRTPANDQELADYCQCPLNLIEELRRFHRTFALLGKIQEFSGLIPGSKGKVRRSCFSMRCRSCISIRRS